MSEEERAAIVTLIAENPMVGDLIQGTGGCHKIRIAGRGKGKSGGFRLITAYGGERFPVFLVTVFGKGEKDNLSKPERNDLAKLTKILFDQYSS